MTTMVPTAVATCAALGEGGSPSGVSLATLMLRSNWTNKWYMISRNGHKIQQTWEKITTKHSIWALHCTEYRQFLKHCTWSTYLITHHNNGHQQWHQQDLWQIHTENKVMVRFCQLLHLNKGDKIPFQHWLRSCTISNIVLSDLYGTWYNKRCDPLMLCLREVGRHLTSVQV